jgi:ubiquitin carboxyl-terminal hydrolase 4/11/15
LSFRYPRLLKKFNSTRPKWIDPRQFLHPNLQNMFDVSYFSEGNVSIPNGWSVVQDDNRLPRLITRQPKEDVPDMEPESPATWPASEESGSEGTAAIEPSATTRMVDESSEDSDFPKPKVYSSAARTNF